MNRSAAVLFVPLVVSVCAARSWGQQTEMKGRVTQVVEKGVVLDGVSTPAKDQAAAARVAAARALAEARTLTPPLLWKENGRYWQRVEQAVFVYVDTSKAVEGSPFHGMVTPAEPYWLGSHKLAAYKWAAAPRSATPPPASGLQRNPPARTRLGQ